MRFKKHPKKIAAAVLIGLKELPRLKRAKQTENADRWKSFGKRRFNKKKDYKHLIGSDKPLKGKKYGKK